MRKTITDFSGQEWYVESDQAIEVEQCPNCGKPLKVKLVEKTPISHIVFRNEQGKVLGTFDTEAWPAVDYGFNLGSCHFCGWCPD